MGTSDNNNNPLKELTDFFVMSANVLNAAASNLPQDQRESFNNELIKQGYDKKMGELRNKMQELNNLNKKA